MKFNEIDFSIRNILLFFGIVVLFSLIYATRDILLLFIISVLIAYLLNPLVEVFVKIHIPRFLSVLILVLILIFILLLILTGILPVMINDVKYLINHTPEYISNVFTFIEKLLAKYNIEFSPSLLNFVYNALNDVIDNNIIYDESETARMRDLAASEVDTITQQIKEGDFLIKKDTIVTEQALRTIDIINSSNAKLDFVKIFGQVVFFSVVTLAAIYYFFSSISRSYRIAQYTFIFVIGVILSIIATYFVYRFVDSQYI